MKNVEINKFNSFHLNNCQPFQVPFLINNLLSKNLLIIMQTLLPISKSISYLTALWAVAKPMGEIFLRNYFEMYWIFNEHPFLVLFTLFILNNDLFSKEIIRFLKRVSIKKRIEVRWKKMGSDEKKICINEIKKLH